MANKKRGGYGKIKINKDCVVKRPIDNKHDVLFATIREKEILNYLKDCEHVVNMLDSKKYTIKLEKGKAASTRNRCLMKDPLSFVSQMIESLQEIHSKGIVHNDIKAENIIHIDEKLKLIDFGFAFPSTKFTHGMDVLGYLRTEYDKEGQSFDYNDDYKCLDLMLKEQDIEPIDYSLHDIIPNFNPPKPVLPECKLKLERSLLKYIPIDQFVRAQKYDDPSCAVFIHFQPSKDLVDTNVITRDKIDDLLDKNAEFIFPSYHYNKRELIDLYC